MINMQKTVLSEKEWDNTFKKLREEAKEHRKGQIGEESLPSGLFGKGLVKTRTFIRKKLSSLEVKMKGLNKKLETGEISEEEYKIWKNRVYLREYEKFLNAYEKTFVY